MVIIKWVIPKTCLSSFANSFSFSPDLFFGSVTFHIISTHIIAFRIISIHIILTHIIFQLMYFFFNFNNYFILYIIY